MNDFRYFKALTAEVKTEFKVNKEKRAVTCIISTTEDFLGKIIKYGFADAFDKFDIDWLDRDLEKKKYVGVAKCAPGDEWNEEYGKQLAEYRAMKARKNDLNRRLDEFSRRMRINLNNLSRDGRLLEPHKPKYE